MIFVTTTKISVLYVDKDIKKLGLRTQFEILISKIIRITAFLLALYRNIILGMGKNFFLT